jgi:hypothetical protein
METAPAIEPEVVPADVTRVTEPLALLAGQAELALESESAPVPAEPVATLQSAPQMPETREIPAPAPVVEPETVESIATAPAPAPEPARTLPEFKLDLSSDLVQIETDPSKAGQARAAEETDPTQAPRPRRMRTAPAAVADEPLVQVETRRSETAL